MDPTKPSTWTHLGDHPSIEKYGLVEDWREWYGGGDPDGELAAVRSIANQLLLELPNVSVELIVLDDVTTFVKVSHGKLVGDFWSGCEDGTFYLHIDADPSDKRAPEREVDNLTSDELVDMVGKFAPK